MCYQKNRLTIFRIFLVCANPSSKLTTRDAQQCAAALFGQGHPAGFHTASPTSPSGVVRPPTPVSVSKQPVSSPSSTFTTLSPQTPTSTPDTSWWSLCTPSGILSLQDKQTLAMAADYCVVKIDGVDVYAPVGTPQAKLTKDHVVFGGKSIKTVKLVPI